MSEFKQLLLNELGDELSEEERVALPSGLQAIGEIVILNLKPALLPKAKKIAGVVLKKFQRFHTVCLKRGGPEGVFREPNLEVIAGEPGTETIHRENSCTFKLDVAKTMWSQGNLTERKRIASLVREGETVIDFFAGVGYFSIPIAVLSKPKKIYSIELNPAAFHYLRENVWLNKVADKIELVNGDCVAEAPKIIAQGVKADRVLLGLLPAPKHVLPVAMLSVKKGGAIHYEGVAPWREEPKALIQDVAEAAEQAELNATVNKVTRVKSFGPRKEHVVLDITIS